MDSSSPSVDQFAEVLLQESEWYDVGIFLGAPTSELKTIGQNYASNHGTRRCLIELYGCLVTRGKPLSWETIATALRRMGNSNLADKIHSNYILPFIHSSDSSKEGGTEQQPLLLVHETKLCVFNMDYPSPSIDQFAEVLLQESDWYDLGVFLETPISKLKEIEQNYTTNGTRRCLIELYGCLEKTEKSVSWETIAIALRRMGNSNLADKIHSNYILPFIHSSNSSKEGSTEQQQQLPEAMDRSPSDSFVEASNHVVVENNRVDKISEEFQSLSERFAFLVLKIKRSLKQASTTDTEELQDLIKDLCGLAPLPHGQATFEAVFERLKQHCSILNFRILVLLVKNLLSNELKLRKKLKKFAKSVESFKKSAKMIKLVGLIKANQPDGNQKVKLKVRQFWSHFTMNQFETVINEILDTLYDQLSHITVGKGCICVSWVIPNHINASKLIPKLSLEFVQIIGVISLHIGNTVIYDIGEGCETIEAALLQAIELKNTRAIKLLLAVGCSPEVATYHENNAVTVIVNIREKSCDSDMHSGSVDHMCILGHNEHVEAIVNPSREPECSPSRLSPISWLLWWKKKIADVTGSYKHEDCAANEGHDHAVNEHYDHATAGYMDPRVLYCVTTFLVMVMTIIIIWLQNSCDDQLRTVEIEHYHRIEKLCQEYVAKTWQDVSDKQLSTVRKNYEQALLETCQVPELDKKKKRVKKLSHGQETKTIDLHHQAIFRELIFHVTLESG